MKVDTLLDRIGGKLSEGFDDAVVWTKAQLLEYLKLTLKDFATLTRIVDKHSVRMCHDATITTGFDVPMDFISAFHVMYDQKHVDLVRYNEMDFVGGGWLSGETATQPLACTQQGSGPLTLMALTPRLTGIAGTFAADVVTEVYLESPDGTVWSLELGLGVVNTAVSPGSTAITLTLPGPGSAWDVTIDNLGVLSTAASVGTPQTVYLTDTIEVNKVWILQTDAAGVIDPTDMGGVTYAIELGGTRQDFIAGDNSATIHAGDPNNMDYGVLVDICATGVSTTPSDVCLLDAPTGIAIFERSMDSAATLYYIADFPEPANSESTVFIHDVFVPVIEHGILAQAYDEDYIGRDQQKAEMLRLVFEAECLAIREMFGRR